jgi:hypothetical protein
VFVNPLAVCKNPVVSTFHKVASCPISTSTRTWRTLVHAFASKRTILTPLVLALRDLKCIAATKACSQNMLLAWRSRTLNKLTFLIPFDGYNHLYHFIMANGISQQGGDAK